MTAFAPLRSKFDPFLFAVVVERDGLPLTVLSMLSRLDLDPWQEAARLSELPKTEAISSFAAAIRRTSNSFGPAPDANDLASRLIDLLPSRERLVAHAMAAETADLSTIWVICAVFFAMMALTERHVPHANEKDVPVQTVETQQSPQPGLLTQQHEKYDATTSNFR
jgi:hypothetical protein